MILVERACTLHFLTRLIACVFLFTLRIEKERSSIYPYEFSVCILIGTYVLVLALVMASSWPWITCDNFCNNQWNCKLWCSKSQLVIAVSFVILIRISVYIKFWVIIRALCLVKSQAWQLLVAWQLKIQQERRHVFQKEGNADHHEKCFLIWHSLFKVVDASRSKTELWLS
jgi:hypothetical protein